MNTGMVGYSFLPTYASNPPTNRYLAGVPGTYDANGNLMQDSFHGNALILQAF